MIANKHQIIINIDIAMSSLTKIVIAAKLTKNSLKVLTSFNNLLKITPKVVIDQEKRWIQPKNCLKISMTSREKMIL